MTKDFECSSFLFGSNSVFIEELYQKYLDFYAATNPIFFKFVQIQNYETSTFFNAFWLMWFLSLLSAVQ